MSRETKDPFPRDEVIEKIFEHFSPKMLAITLGSEGMLLAGSWKGEIFDTDSSVKCLMCRVRVIL